MVAYGLILPKAVLEIAPHGAVNVHASVLPRWRGAAPIQRAILAGDKTTGVTIMQMDEGLDTGDILSLRECAIDDKETAASLTTKLASLGAELLVNTLDKMEKGPLSGEPQNDAAACYAHKLSKEEGRIDWQASAQQICSLVRGMNPWPTAFTELDGQSLKIWQVTQAQDDENPNCMPGQVIQADKNGLCIATGDGVVLISELQLAGSKRMSWKAFVNSGKVSVGTVLG